MRLGHQVELWPARGVGSLNIGQVAIQPGPPDQRGSSRGGDTAKLRLGRGRKRHPLLALTFALLGLGGLAVTGYLIQDQLKPRTFTVAQQRKIEAWEIARRWRAMPKTRIFPASIGYQVSGQTIGASSGLKLTAWRLAIAPQAPCARADGARSGLAKLLNRDGCQTVLRATYADATSSLVVTVGIEVLKDQASAIAIARYLTHAPPLASGSASHALVLHPFQVVGTPAATFGLRQRQLSWVVGAGSYVVMATVGYADGRPRVQANADSYTYLEMTSLARGIAAAVAAPLGAPPAVPHCPGALSAC